MKKLKEILKDKLSESELKLVPSSFDIIGSREKAVAIVEIPDELKPIAEAIMRLHKNVKSVLKKTSERKGELRLRSYELIAGDADTEVLHKEHGYVLKLDPQKVYFSPREARERQRIAEQVKAGETVMVMFSGVAPFAIAIAKKQPNVEKIIAVEINPDAVWYAEENIRINKLSHKIISILGDVRDACKRWYGKCDRVIMPLPLGAESFLDIALKCLRDEGIVHFYNWGEGKGKKLFSQALKKIKMMKDVDYKIIGKRKVLPYAPGKYKVCIDISVQKKSHGLEEN